MNTYYEQDGRFNGILWQCLYPSCNRNYLSMYESNTSTSHEETNGMEIKVRLIFQ